MRLKDLWTNREGIHSLFGFSKHGGLRDIWKGSRKATTAFERYFKVSVASRLKCQMEVVSFSFKIYIHSTSVSNKTKRYGGRRETKEFSNGRKKKQSKKKGGGWGGGENLALRRQVVTQGN